MKLILILCLCTGGAAFAQEPEANRTPSKANVRKAPPLEPSWEFIVKDSANLNQIVQKNAWYQEFRKSPMFDGTFNQLSPVLFSLANEYGAAAKSWKGRLIDFVYDQVASGKPVQFSYYSRAGLTSPAVLTIFKLGKAEKKVVDTFVGLFRSGDDKEIETTGGKTQKVTPLLIRNQRFAIVVRDDCFSISRDPGLAGAKGAACTSLAKPKHDAVVKVQLSQVFPAFAGLREKFVSADDVVEMNMKWVSSGSRFEMMGGTLNFSNPETPLQKSKIAENLMRALPESTFFWGSLNLPSFNTFKDREFKNYLSAGAKVLKSRKPASYALFYAPYEAENKNTKAATGMLMQFKGANAATMEELAALLKEHKSGEVFMRPVCDDMIVLSNQKLLVQLVDEVCAKKRASVADAMKVDSSLEDAARFFFSPGRMLSRYMKMGWEKSKKVSSPAEIEMAERLLEDLPSYHYSGKLDSKLMTFSSVVTK